MTRLSRLALLSGWFALTTGFAELALRGIQAFGLHRFLYLSRKIVWMTPVADLALFLAVGLLLALLSLAWRPAASTRAVTTVLAFVAALSIATLQPWLAWWAMMAIAAGVAVQAGLLASRHEETTMRLVRRTMTPLVGLAIAFAAAVVGGIALAERRAIAALPAAPRGAPNVVVVLWDAVRAQDLSLYGYPRQTTPNLEALARRGVAFDRAISTASWTAPSHASLFTGKWAHELYTTWKAPMRRNHPTLAGALAARGWRTAAFSGNRDVVNWERGLLRGFSHFEAYGTSPAEVARSSALLHWLMGFRGPRIALGWYDKPGRRNAAELQAAFLAWLDRDRERPFFGFLNLYDAHDPYLPPPPYDTMFGWPAGAGADERARSRLAAISDAYRWSPAEIARQQARYDGVIAELDHNLQRLLDGLSERHLLENTIVIVTADHGEGFGEHGTFSHGDDAYLQVLHIPLVIVMPGRIAPGRRVSGLVSLRDVAATIGELTGNAGPAWPLPGRSLTRFLDSTASTADTVLAEVDSLPRGGQPWFPVRRGNVRTILALPWHLIATGNSLELFDIVADPAEAHDLAGQAAMKPVRDSLHTALLRWRQHAVPTKR